MTEEEINRLEKEIRKDFFSQRNGIVAETLKMVYGPDKLIYGLIVPQFIEMAKKYPHDISLALKLWDNNNIRENRLFALYILPPGEADYETAKKLINEVESKEQAEFLAFKILRNIPDTFNMWEKLNNEMFSTDFSRYCMEMYKRNLEVLGDLS